jgi:DDE superfamily endonuclease
MGRRVYIDETGATTGMTRLRGRAAPGKRVIEAVPQGCWQMTTLIGALRRDGPTAALAFDGATDAAAFESFVQQTLCPTLRRGDLVVMDRLSAHRDPIVRQMIEAVGARLLYLPPYSPDLKSDRGDVVQSQTAPALRGTAEPRRLDQRDG